MPLSRVPPAPDATIADLIAASPSYMAVSYDELEEMGHIQVSIKRIPIEIEKLKVHGITQESIN